MQDLRRYYELNLVKHGVNLHLNTQVDSALISAVAQKDAVDVVIVAAGSRIDKSQIPGGENAVAAQDLLAGHAAAGPKVVVLGGGKVGLCTAEYLAIKGHQVTVVDPEKRLAGDVIPTWKWRHTQWAEELGIRTLTKTRVRQVLPSGVQLVNAAGEETFLEVDTVVAAAPRKAEQSFLDSVEFMVDELFAIGDAVAPRGLNQAIHDGFRLGVRI